jgi:RNA polymerase sigma-70 factor (ECF subfamily)
MGGQHVARPSREELAVLAAAAARQDPRAMRAFVRAIAETIRRSVRVVLGAQNWELEDVMQEATIGFLDALVRFRGECTMSQFARRVAILTALAAKRRQQTVARWVVTDAAAAEGGLAPSEDSPLAQMEMARQREWISRLLDDLPDALAETVVFYFMLGHTVEEIAVMTSVPVNTVWSRVRLGRERLRRLLEESPSLREALDRTDGNLQ